MSPDTSPQAQDAYFAALRRLGPEGRVLRALDLSAFTRQTSAAGVRARHPDYSEEQVMWALRRLLFGEALFRRAWPDAPVLAP